MNQLERYVTKAIKDAASGGTHTVMLGQWTAEMLLREWRTARDECRRWPLAMFAGMVLMMLFGIWLGQRASATCAAPRMQFKATQLETASLVHRRKIWRV